MKHLPIALGIVVAVSPVALSQQAPKPTVAFPMDVVDTAGPLGSYELAPRAAEYASLTSFDAIRMADVILPDGNSIVLDLTRIDFDFAKLGVHVDQKEIGSWDPGDLTMWKGTVEGDPFSEVTIGFASLGTYGWISTMGETWNVSAFAGVGGDWSSPGCRMWAETVSDLVRDPSEKFVCLSDGLPTNIGGQTGSVDRSSGGVSRGVLKECKVAIETDYQLFQLFGNLAAEQNYMGMLLGAISDRFETEVDVVLTYPYLMYHTTSNDGWTTADTGGDTGDMLAEFRSAWIGNIPAGAHLAHFISGAGLGGGIAYLDVLCNQDFGFGVSANLGGSVNFPVSQGSGNWDFIVISHELGHNFSSPHTHDFCPPLDQCAPQGYFGSCQTSQQCTSQGTIMSYCHLCSGGTTNITTFFHPEVVTQIRGAVASSCLPDYNGGGGGCQDDSFEPNDTCAGATPLSLGMNSGFIVKDDNDDVFSVSVPDTGSLTIDVLFSHAAGDVDARLETSNCSTQLDQGISGTDNEQLTWQNNTGQTQEVRLTVYNYPQADCFSYDIDVDVQVDPCAGFPPDSLEDNDTCSTATPMGIGSTQNLTVSGADLDFYTILVESGATLTATTLFSDAVADIDIYLYDPSISCGDNADYLTRGFSASDDESVSWTNSTGVDRNYILEVQIYNGGSGDCNSYELIIDPGMGVGIGQSYCDPAVPNSTGLPGLLDATGSASISANDLTLVASQLPVGSLGYFLVSSVSGLVPNPGGSTGNLCLLPPFGRYLQFAGAVAPDGTFSMLVDANAIPQPTSTVMVQSGETWYFQFWHRDALIGIATSNFTEGFEVQFQQ